MHWKRSRSSFTPINPAHRRARIAPSGRPLAKAEYRLLQSKAAAERIMQWSLWEKTYSPYRLANFKTNRAASTRIAHKALALRKGLYRGNSKRRPTIQEVYRTFMPPLCQALMESKWCNSHKRVLIKTTTANHLWYLSVARVLYKKSNSPHQFLTKSLTRRRAVWAWVRIRYK